jgi:hypothetical protein
MQHEQNNAGRAERHQYGADRIAGRVSLVARNLGLIGCVHSDFAGRTYCVNALAPEWVPQRPPFSAIITK